MIRTSSEEEVTNFLCLRYDRSHGAGRAGGAEPGHDARAHVPLNGTSHISPLFGSKGERASRPNESPAVSAITPQIVMVQGVAQVAQ
jgi:hypothetical protein